jgi:hypothetical protein
MVEVCVSTLTNFTDKLVDPNGHWLIKPVPANEIVCLFDDDDVHIRNPYDETMMRILERKHKIVCSDTFYGYGGKRWYRIKLKKPFVNAYEQIMWQVFFGSNSEREFDTWERTTSPDQFLSVMVVMNEQNLPDLCPVCYMKENTCNRATCKHRLCNDCFIRTMASNCPICRNAPLPPPTQPNNKYSSLAQEAFGALKRAYMAVDERRKVVINLCR